MQYLVAIFHPDDYDPASEDPETVRAISALNEEMVDAGVRVFVGGLQPPARAKSFRRQSKHTEGITDGPYLETKEQIGGFWVLDVADEGDALEWGRKAAAACRTPVEVRAFNRKEDR